MSSDQRRLDLAAQQMGFPDYAKWQAYHAKYQEQGNKKGVAVAQKKNFLQGLLEQIPWHPSYLFKHVNDAYDKAIGNPPQ